MEQKFVQMMAVTWPRWLPCLYVVKGEHNLKAYRVAKYRTLQTMDFDTNLIKIGGKLRKLRTIEYLNIDGMGAAILNI